MISRERNQSSRIEFTDFCARCSSRRFDSLDYWPISGVGYPTSEYKSFFGEKSRWKTWRTNIFGVFVLCVARYVAAFSMEKKRMCDLINRRLVDIRQTIFQKFALCVASQCVSQKRSECAVIMRGKFTPTVPYTFEGFLSRHAQLCLPIYHEAAKKST